MQFSVGDKVVQPGIGAGRVVGTKKQELVAGFTHYYVIAIPERNSTIYVPVRSAEALGVRPVMSQRKLNRVLATLASVPQPLPRDYVERQEQIELKIKTDQPLQVAEVVRDLAGRGRSASLTAKDREQLARGRYLLAGEIAVVTETQMKDVNVLIDERLTAGQARA
jgi:RNA polymerase-interacting CarD/CdnL/TRCF family regulator